MARVLIAYSDCLDVKEIHLKTNLIKYTNENDFAGLVYSIDAPQTFELRIDSKFFKERQTEENESEGLSDGSVVKLSSETKSQMLLQVEPCPYYLHKIIRLALQHNSIEINDLFWEKEEAYGQNELDEKFPLEKAEAWLTMKDDELFTNVYGTTN